MQDLSSDDLDGLVLSLPPRPAASVDAMDNVDVELDRAREVEKLRYEELFEWYVAETENLLVMARQNVKSVEDVQRKIVVDLAKRRNMCVVSATLVGRIEYAVGEFPSFSFHVRCATASALCSLLQINMLLQVLTTAFAACSMVCDERISHDVTIESD